LSFLYLEDYSQIKENAVLRPFSVGLARSSSIFFCFCLLPGSASYAATPSPAGYTPSPSNMAYSSSSPIGGYSPNTPGSASPYNPLTPAMGFEQTPLNAEWHTPDIEVRIRGTHDDSGLGGQTGIIRGISVSSANVREGLRKNYSACLFLYVLPV